MGSSPIVSTRLDQGINGSSGHLGLAGPTGGAIRGANVPVGLPPVAGQQRLHRRGAGFDGGGEHVAIDECRHPRAVVPSTSATCSSGIPAADISDAAEWRISYGVHRPIAARSHAWRKYRRRFDATIGRPLAVVNTSCAPSLGCNCTIVVVQ